MHEGGAGGEEGAGAGEGLGAYTVVLTMSQLGIDKKPGCTRGGGGNRCQSSANKLSKQPCSTTGPFSRHLPVHEKPLPILGRRRRTGRRREGRSGGRTRDKRRLNSSVALTSIFFALLGGGSK